MKKDTSTAMTTQKATAQKKYFRLVVAISLIAILLTAITPLLGEVGMASDSTVTTLGRWIGFLGAFHPLILHLPIGVVTLVLIMEAASILTRRKYTANTTLALAFASATGVLASTFGYCLYLVGDCSGELIEEHKRDGIIFTILLILTFLTRYSLDIGLMKKFLKPTYAIGLIATTILMISAGHHGGEITHGDPMDKAPWKKGSATHKTHHTSQSAPAYDPVVYSEIIAPILVEKCNTCHGDKKQKGDLRMDSYAALLKGGEYEKCLVPGDIEQSTMISFLHLPLDDDLRMPPEGKPQLTEGEITILTWWVKEGAPEFKKLSEIEKTPALSEALQSVK